MRVVGWIGMVGVIGWSLVGCVAGAAEQGVVIKQSSLSVYNIGDDYQVSVNCSDWSSHMCVIEDGSVTNRCTSDGYMKLNRHGCGQFITFDQAYRHENQEYDLHFCFEDEMVSASLSATNDGDVGELFSETDYGQPTHVSGPTLTACSTQ